MCFHLRARERERGECCRFTHPLALAPRSSLQVCWWLTAQQLGDLRSSESAGSVGGCCAADVTARLGCRLLSQNGSHQRRCDSHNPTFALANDFNIFHHWVCVCVCVFLLICRARGGENACQSNQGRGTSWLFNVRETHFGIFLNLDGDIFYLFQWFSKHLGVRMCHCWRLLPKTEKFRFWCWSHSRGEKKTNSFQMSSALHRLRKHSTSLHALHWRRVTY